MSRACITDKQRAAFAAVEELLTQEAPDEWTAYQAAWEEWEAYAAMPVEWKWTAPKASDKWTAREAALEAAWAQVKAYAGMPDEQTVRKALMAALEIKWAAEAAEAAYTEADDAAEAAYSTLEDAWAALEDAAPDAWAAAYEERVEPPNTLAAAYEEGMDAGDAWGAVAAAAPDALAAYKTAAAEYEAAIDVREAYREAAAELESELDAAYKKFESKMASMTARALNDSAVHKAYGAAREALEAAAPAAANVYFALQSAFPDEWRAYHEARRPRK